MWEANWEHCNMHGRNKQQLSPHTRRAQHQIRAPDPRLPLSLLGAAPCAWQRDTRRNWRTHCWQSTSKTLLSLGMDEKLCYLYSSDDTEGIVIRGYFRICETPSKLLNGQTLLLYWDLRGRSWLQPFSVFHKVFSVLCRLYWHLQWDFNYQC